MNRNTADAFKMVLAEFFRTPRRHYFLYNRINRKIAIVYILGMVAFVVPHVDVIGPIYEVVRKLSKIAGWGMFVFTGILGYCR